MKTENESRKPPSLEIRLFGTFQVLVHGEPMPPLRSRQGQALFGLLVLRHASEIDREWLAFALWPDSSETQARYNLRRNLTDLRHSLGGESWRLLSPSPRSLRFDLTGAMVDSGAFDACLAAGGREQWERAAALYCGELLPGCDAEILLEERRQREQAYFDALEKLANDAAERDPGAAIAWLRRLLAADPLRETALRDLMQALSRRGELAAITEAFRDFRLYLHRELNAEPAPETLALYRKLSLPNRDVPSLVRAAAPAVSRRLPAPLTRLIGRETETSAILAALRIARLLTLTGTGGIGKTRLALEAAEAAEDFPGGAWFVDLSPLTESASVLPALAAALEVAPQAGETTAAALKMYLAPRRALLLLDNCEHLIAAVAAAAQALLTDCPQLKILATSRQPLGIMGEALRQVPALEPPPEPPKRAGRPDANFMEALRENAAVQLFIERAKLARPDWGLTPANAGAVSQICRTLDGLPLAIELAAARMAALAPEEIAARLKDRFRLLSSGNRGAWPRHQNLTALLDWSYDLLSEKEQALFRRLAIFAGGWSLETAEQVCGVSELESGAGGAGEVFYLLAGLVEKSLVVCDSMEETARYRMLETVRQYARQRFEAEPGDVERTAARHAERFLAMALQAETERDGPEQIHSFTRLEQEKDNLRAALTFLQKDAANAEKALCFACGICHFWSLRGYLNEGYALLTDCLQAAGEATHPELRAKALKKAGGLAHGLGEFAQAVSHYEAALALYRLQGNRRGEAQTLGELGDVFSNRGEYDRARDFLSQGLDLSRKIQDASNETYILSRLGYVAREQGDYAESQRLTQQALDVNRRVGDRLGEGWSLGSLGYAFLGAGDSEKAVSHFEQCLIIYRECGQRSGEAWTLTSLGHAARLRGDYAQSRAYLESGRAIYQEIGLRASEAWNLDELGATLVALGERDAARRVLYDSLCINRESGARRSEAIVLFRLGHLFREEGDAILARRFYAESSHTLLEMDLSVEFLDVVEGLALLETQAERPQNAARLGGAIHAFRRSQNAPSPAGTNAADPFDLRRTLGEANFQALHAEGETLTLAQAAQSILRFDAAD